MRVGTICYATDQGLGILAKSFYDNGIIGIYVGCLAFFIIVLIIVLVVFGGAKLPKLARSLGEAQKEFKKGLAEASADDDDDAPTDPKASDKKSA